MALDFRDRLRLAQNRNRSWVCVGLDPVLERLPDVVRGQSRPLLTFAKAIVEATADVVSAYKPNLAFWLAEGQNGLTELRDTIALVPDGIPVVLDAKFGDVGHTARALARVAFDHFDADAVTTNPYLGLDALRPFLEREGRGIFVLARTSNPSAPEVQDLASGGVRVFEAVARLAAAWDDALPGTCGIVVGATYPGELKRLREVAPSLPFLIPGIGSQGGSLQAAVAYGPTLDHIGPLINSSRSIIFASNGPDFAEAARSAAMSLRDRINEQRE